MKRKVYIETSVISYLTCTDSLAVKRSAGDGQPELHA